MSIDEELIKVKSFFDEKAKTHGPVFQSGDWNSLERQNIMFQQLLKIWSNSVLSASIIDFGCGYGYPF